MCTVYRINENDEPDKTYMLRFIRVSVCEDLKVTLYFVWDPHSFINKLIRKLVLIINSMIAL